MTRQRVDGSFDFQALMQDAANIIATVAGKVATVARIYDAGLGRVDARLIFDITAAEVATGNESYRVQVQVSSSSSFATDVWNVAGVQLGDSSVSLETVDTIAGRRELAFTNEINGTVYRYIRVHFVVAGTIDTTGLSVGNMWLTTDA